MGEGDRRRWSELPFALVESKFHPPWARSGIVPRTVLVDRLLANPAPVVCVVAPAGYGKTTLLAQWVQQEPRPVAWVSVDRRDNDPTVLLAYLAAALDRVQRIDPAVVQALTAPGVSVMATVVPRLVAAVWSMTDPVAVILDHLELLANQECLDAVAEVALQLPPEWQLALASRTKPPLPVALLRAQGRVVEIGTDELAMNDQEARALLAGAGVGFSDLEVAELIGRTEGWPVGLYLATLARQAAGPQPGAVTAFRGDDRLLVDYLGSELLGHLAPEREAFLTRTAVLERMSGPLCDAVLETTGSGQVLAWLEESNLLVVPLDRQRSWYRYHHLFGELLRSELDRREPELVPQLHARAAAWCEANGLPETAIDHAQAAGDADRVARLVTILIRPTYAAGRIATARRWLAWFEDQRLIERYPSVAVLGAYVQALAGQPVGAERWADAAERGSKSGTLPDGSTVQSYLAMLRALLCRGGVERMRADAQLARDQLGPDSGWRGAALLLEGMSYLLVGDADRADPILAHATEVASGAGALPAAAAALAERCLVAIGRQDWAQAETLAEQALTTVKVGQLASYLESALGYAVAAHTTLHRGDVPRAREHLAQATRLRPLLSPAIPQLGVQTLLELTRAYLALDDSSGARAVLRQARDILRVRPDLGVLPGQAEELWSKLDISRGVTLGVASLTTAELRLLPLLPTHLSYREIGQRLYVAPSTVKTQALSMYRKLGVSSRSQAVQHLHQLGLSDDR